MLLLVYCEMVIENTWNEQYKIFISHMNTVNLPFSGQPRITSMECKKQKGAMPWLSWLADSWLSSWRTSSNPRPDHVEFVVDKVALGEVTL
jgi:hypothetical protein